MSERASEFPGTNRPPFGLGSTSGHRDLGRRLDHHIHGGQQAGDSRGRSDSVRFSARRSGRGSRFGQPTSGWYARTAIVASAGGGVALLLIAAARGVFQ